MLNLELLAMAGLPVCNKSAGSDKQSQWYQSARSLVVFVDSILGPRQTQLASTFERLMVLSLSYYFGEQIVHYA